MIEPDEANCPSCRAPIHMIGEETSQQLDVIPTRSPAETGCPAFVDDGRIEIESNVVERAIRPIALNRKNPCSQAPTEVPSIGLWSIADRDVQAD